VRPHRLALLSALLLAGLPAGAGIYRCTDAAGAVTYQEIPCPTSSDGRATNLPTDFPEVDRAERDRLLQRADAAEARLLRRLEIETMERIARDERVSREKIAMIQAEAERNRVDDAPALLVVRQRARPRRHSAVDEMNSAAWSSSASSRTWRAPPPFYR